MTSTVRTAVLDTSAGGHEAREVAVARLRSMRRVSAAVAMLIAAGAVGGCGSRESDDATRTIERPNLMRAVRQLAAERSSRVLARVETDDGVWRAAVGRADGTPLAGPDARFEIASTTKTFVATVVLQLVGEGRLELDDTVEQRLPGRLRDGRRITIRQLLNHTSGLPQELSLDSPSAQPPLLSRPGSGHSYANANYDVLGLIVERVSGRPLNLVVRDRVFERLDLRDTSYGDSDGPVRGAGGIVSTARDVARFFKALVRGELLDDDLLAEMKQTVPVGTEFHAGLGLFRADLPCGSAWGHGGEFSYSNQVLVSHDGATAVVVAQNQYGWSAVKDTAENIYCRLR